MMDFKFPLVAKIKLTVEQVEEAVRRYVEREYKGGVEVTNVRLDTETAEFEVEIKPTLGER